MASGNCARAAPADNAPAASASAAVSRGTVPALPIAIALAHRLLQILTHLVEEAGGGEPLLVGADQERQIFGHEARLDRIHRDLFKRRGEFRELGIVVELGTVCEPARPGENRRDRIGRGLAALLMLAVMPRHRAVGGFR